MTDAFIREKRGRFRHTDTETHREEGHVKTEVETGLQ